MYKKVEAVALIIVLVGVIIASERIGRAVMSSAPVTESKEDKKWTVVIDSGHGGSDPGKVGANNALEKDINLSITKKLKKLLSKENINVICTRETEDGLADSKVEDMKYRVSLINKEKPDLVLSIHQNSYQDGAVHGAQVFYYTHSEKGKEAALIMQEALKIADEGNERPAKANDTYYMLKKTEVPVIIVECGFLSNYEEAEKLVTEEYQQKIAEAVCSGAMQYLEKESQ